VVGVGLGREAHDDFTLTYVAVALQGRAAIGPVEPYLGVELAPFHEGTRGIELPTIQHVYLGTRVAIAGETAIGVEGGATSVGSDIRGYYSDLYLDHRFRPSKNVAVQLRGGGEFTSGQVPGRYGYYVETFQWVAAYAASTVQLQLTPEVAVQASALIAQHAFLHRNVDRYYRSHSYGGGLVVSVRDGMDLVPYFSVSTVEPRQGMVGSLSVVVR
jgi:hypothetical protein